MAYRLYYPDTDGEWQIEDDLNGQVFFAKEVIILRECEAIPKVEGEAQYILITGACIDRYKERIIIRDAVTRKKEHETKK